MPHRSSHPIAKGRRICRKRGHRGHQPEGVVYVGRPTLWGNPFTSRCSGHAKSVILHRRWLHCELGAISLERMGFSLGEIDGLYRRRDAVLTGLHRLTGKHLSCWCPLSSRWCHADTLLDLAPRFDSQTSQGM